MSAPFIEQARVENAPIPAEEALPDFLKDETDRKRIAKEVFVRIKASEEAVGRLKERWKEVDDAEALTPRQSLAKPWPSAPWYHFGVVRPKLQQGTSFVALPMTKADPYVVVRGGGPTGDRVDAVERALHWHLARAEFPRMVRMGLNVAQRRAKAVLRSTYIPSGIQNGRIRFPKLSLETFSPEHIRQYPEWATDVEDCTLFGHVYETRLGAIETLQEAGYYLKDSVTTPAGEPDEYKEALLQDRKNQAATGKDITVRPGEFFMKFDEDDDQKWYQVQYDIDAQSFLRVVEYKRYRTPWYHDFYLHEEYGRWLFENSRGSDLLGPQYYSNDMRNLATWGAMYALIPPIFGPNGSLPDDIQQLKPGAFYPTNYGGQMWSPSGRVDLSMLPALIQMASNDVDIVSNFSANASGAYKGGEPPTATEVREAAFGQGQAVSDDAAYAGFGVSKMAEFCATELLYEHYDDWYPHFASVLPELKREDLDRPYLYEPNASSVALPGEVIQEVSALTKSIADLARFRPDLLDRYPKLFEGLMKAAIQAMDSIAQKDEMLEEATIGGLQPTDTGMLGSAATAGLGEPGVQVLNGGMG